MKTLKTLLLSTPQVGMLSHGCHSILTSHAGYKPAAGKSVDEYRDLDAKDESLARWKASLGLDAASSGDASQPKVGFRINVLFIGFIHPLRSLPSWAWS
jgi:hypothetical protein